MHMHRVKLSSPFPQLERDISLGNTQRFQMSNFPLQRCKPPLHLNLTIQQRESFCNCREQDKTVSWLPILNQSSASRLLLDAHLLNIPNVMHTLEAAHLNFLQSVRPLLVPEAGNASELVHKHPRLLHGFWSALLKRRQHPLHRLLRATAYTLPQQALG